MSEWQPIDSAPMFESVLVQHVEDLTPVVAFRVSADNWMLEREGPEDTDDGRPGKFSALYRPPTHWMPLPEPPMAEWLAAQKGK